MIAGAARQGTDYSPAFASSRPLPRVYRGLSRGQRPVSPVLLFKINGYWRRRRDSNPRYRIYQYDGLANRWFQPLTHVSRLQRRRRYSEPRGGRQVRLLACEIRPDRVCRRAEFGPSARNSCCPARFRLDSSPVHCRFATCGFHCAMRDCVRALRDRARGGAHLDRGTDRQ